MITAVQTVSLLSIIIIIGYLIYVYLDVKDLKTKKSESKKMKISSSKCPDFFEIEEDKGKEYCKNVYNLGKCANTPDNNRVSFDHEIFRDLGKGDYMKCEWARECDVPWSGIDRLC